MTDFTIELIQVCSSVDDFTRGWRFPTQISRDDLCLWDEECGKAQTEEQKEKRVCPECGKNTFYLYVAT